MSIRHGIGDSAIAHRNFNELIDQWTDVHGTDQVADSSETVNGNPHRTLRDTTGRAVVDSWSISGMNH